MIHIASRLPPTAFAWLPVQVFRVVIAAIIVSDSIVNTLWSPFRALGVAVLAFFGELAESIAAAWQFWIPCRCVKHNEFLSTLPFKDGVKRPKGPSPDCSFCEGRGGVGLWVGSGRVAKRLKGVK